jgi:hypothetical protein
MGTGIRIAVVVCLLAIPSQSQAITPRERSLLLAAFGSLMIVWEPMAVSVA